MRERADHDQDVAADDAATNRRRLAIAGAVVAGVAVVALVALGGDGGDPAVDPTTDTVVDAVRSGAAPDELRYAVALRTDVGVRPNVTNDDDTPHTYTSDDGLFDSGPLDPGETATLPSLEAGTYPYHCEIHPDLTGELVISG